MLWPSPGGLAPAIRPIFPFPFSRQEIAISWKLSDPSSGASRRRRACASGRHCHGAVAFEHAGVLGDAQRARGYELRLLCGRHRRSGNGGARSARLVSVILGGPIGVYENDVYPWLDAEVETIRQRLRDGLPMIGISPRRAADCARGRGAGACGDARDRLRRRSGRSAGRGWLHRWRNSGGQTGQVSALACKRYVRLARRRDLVGFERCGETPGLARSARRCWRCSFTRRYAPAISRPG